MPIFDFICRSCGSKFEALILNNKKDDVLCGNCGSNSVDKLYSMRFGIGKESSFDFGGDRGVVSSSKCGGCISKSCNTCF